MLKVFYGVYSHRAGGERRVVLHATSAALAERMGWAGFVGSRQFWSLVLVEAIDFQATQQEAVR